MYYGKEANVLKMMTAWMYDVSRWAHAPLVCWRYLDYQWLKEKEQILDQMKLDFRVHLAPYCTEAIEHTRIIKFHASINGPSVPP